MVLNVISVLALVALAAFFGWLATRAWRSRSAIVRWPGLVLSGLLSLILVAVTLVALLGFYRLGVAPYRYTVSDVAVAMTPEQVARGEDLAHLCADCHSSAGQLPLDGSAENFLAGPGVPPLGELWATNLTPGGPLKDWTDGEIIRAIREGVDNNGRPLFAMPSMGLHAMSDADAQALVAYLRSQPAVERDIPDRNLNVLAALFVGAGMVPSSAMEPITAPVAHPELGTAEYGRYLTQAFGCIDCHGERLDGVPLVSMAPGGINLTTTVPQYGEADFIRLFREGVHPSGRPIDSAAMPWKSYSEAFTDEELSSLYIYLHGLERVETPPQ